MPSEESKSAPIDKSVVPESPAKLEAKPAGPIVNFRPLRDRNFAISSLIIFLAFAVLYGTSTLLPALLESLFGYDAFHAGLVLSPSGVSAILALIVVGA